MRTSTLKLNQCEVCKGHFFRKGYEQAEKDLVLTWKDIRKISRILEMIIDDDINGKIPEEWGDEEYYEEVLRRFNKAKEETK